MLEKQTAQSMGFPTSSAALAAEGLGCECRVSVTGRGFLGAGWILSRTLLTARASLTSEVVELPSAGPWLMNPAGCRLAVCVGSGQLRCPWVVFPKQCRRTSVAPCRLSLSLAQLDFIMKHWQPWTCSCRGAEQRGGCAALANASTPLGPPRVY